MSDRLEFHPLANRFPLMEEVEFNKFVAHMDEKGFDPKQPIITHEGMILDGRNRYRACERLEITPVLVEYAGEWGSPEEYVRKVNRFRCHYTQSQLAAVAADQHILNSGTGVLGTPPPSVQGLAEEHGVSKTAVQQAKRVRKHGSQAINELLTNGHVSTSDAAAVLKLPKETQDAAAQKVVSGEARTLVDGAKGDAHEGNGKPEPREKLLDGVGQPVPGHLRDVFATKLFDEYAKKLNELMAMSPMMLASSPWWQGDADTLKKLAEIKQRVKDARPYAVCPECERAKKGCQTCRMMGWLPYWTFDEVHMRGGTANAES